MLEKGMGLGRAAWRGTDSPEGTDSPKRGVSINKDHPLQKGRLEKEGCTPKMASLKRTVSPKKGPSLLIGAVPNEGCLGKEDGFSKAMDFHEALIFMKDESNKD